MRIAFITLGCKVNQYETAALEGMFAAAGYEIAEADGEADVYVLNSCTVTAESDRKARQILRRFKKTNPAAVTALCGCLPQAFPDAPKRLPEADIILGTKNRRRLLSAVQERLAGSGRIVELDAHESGEDFEALRAGSFRERTRAFVKIEDGCERFCSYCIIPHARGPVRSRPIADIQSELEELAASGYREIVLVGINLSCYGADLGLGLADAVRAACSVKGIRRVRLGSLEPELLTDSDIHTLAGFPKLCPQFHLSLQSGCDATLRRMNRHYDVAGYARIVHRLREAFPNAAITTDVMVGFPGETAEEFEASLAFARETGFARAHVFAYSKRPGTPAATWPDQVSKAEKLRRSREMIAITNETRAAFLRSQIGKTVSVLFEARDANGLWEGYSENYTAVKAPAMEYLTGKILPVTITAAEEDSCTGVIRNTI